MVINSSQTLNKIYHWFQTSPAVFTFLVPFSNLKCDPHYAFLHRSVHSWISSQTLDSIYQFTKDLHPIWSCIWTHILKWPITNSSDVFTNLIYQFCPRIFLSLTLEKGIITNICLKNCRFGIRDWWNHLINSFRDSQVEFEMAKISQAAQVWNFEKMPDSILLQ